MPLGRPTTQPPKSGRPGFRWRKLGDRTWMPWLVGSLTLAAGLMVTVYIATLDRSNQHQAAHAATVQYLASLRARIENEIYSTVYLGKSLSAYVATHRNISQREFESLAAEIIAGADDVRNIALAHHDVITHIYPQQGNLAALGLNYRKSPAQWPAVKRAIDLGSTVVAGPVDLVQGGRGLIARTPIYLNPVLYGLNKDGNPKYWGLCSLVIDIAQFVKNLRLDQDQSGFDLALRGRDGLGGQGGIIFGDPALFDQEVVRQDVSLPNGTWQLVARPSTGWAATLQLPIFYIGSGASVLISVLLGLLAQTRIAARRLALQDYLTHLPNRRLLEDRLEQSAALADRNHSGFHLVYVDVNDFKQINDRYGHQLGDAVLIEVAQRLLSTVRRSDTVARIGGDEFVILVNDTGGGNQIDRVLAKLHATLSPPVFSGGETIRVSASIGHARYPQDSRNFDELLSKADQKMYAAKRTKVTPLHPGRGFRG